MTGTKSDDRDPVIEPRAFLSGVKVVDFGDVRVARGLSRRPVSSCPHSNLTYDTAERRIWCQDCEHDVEGYDAFLLLVDGYNRAVTAVERRERAVKEAEGFSLRSMAAKALDEIWRKRNVVPTCPHCQKALLPEMFKGSIGHAWRGKNGFV